MKKLSLKIFFVMLVLLLSLVVFLIYIVPNEQLDLETKKIDVKEKITYMVLNMKTEIILTEDEIDAIIKMAIEPTINEHLRIEGAHFYIENDIVYAKLNVLYLEKIRAELNVSYSFNLSEEGNLYLVPLSINLKDIPLPLSLLEPINYELYDMANSVVKVTEIDNNARQIIIRWKIDLN